MSLHTIRKGLRLPALGEPDQTVGSARMTSRVALLADDYVGLRPTMHVTEGDDVRRGQLLFEDKKRPGVRFTAPGSGRVVAIHRGDRRSFRSIVIELSRDEREGRGADTVRFAAFSGGHPTGLSGDDVRALLVESGLWVAIRSRPFSRVAQPDTRPHAIFVTAIDTEPLAPRVDVVLEGVHGPFERGVAALTRLTDGLVYVCTAPDSGVPVPAGDRIRHEEFAGVHPAGTAGLHIHLVDPVGPGKPVWHVGYQDVVAIGQLFETGDLPVDRVVALSGPAQTRPRMVRSTTRHESSRARCSLVVWRPVTSSGFWGGITVRSACFARGGAAIYSGGSPLGCGNSRHRGPFCRRSRRVGRCRSARRPTAPNGRSCRSVSTSG
jgi:Na+-transporting NADH:ubiquinone oxidoreductase subunit A